MIHHREKSEVRRFDIIKLIVLIILIALLLWFWLAPPAFVRGADDGGETAVAAETEPEIEADTADDSDIAEEMDETVEEEAAAEEEEMPQIDAPSLDSPTAGEALEAGSTTLSGGGTPGSTVRIMIDGQEVGVAEVGADGSWSHDLDLTAGSREISFEALDADGNVAATAASAIFEVAEPPIPLDTPSFDALDTNLLSGPLTLSGGGTPGSTVGIWVDGVEVGTTEVDADGNWSFDADLEAGDHDLRLQAIDLDGNVAGESEDFGLSLAVPPPEFVLPTFDLPDADLAGGDITLSGTGTPGSEVEIVVNGEVVGTAVVADDGTWSFPATLPSGDYELALRAMDGSGTAVSSDPFAFSLAATAAVPTLDAPADGSSLDSGEISFSGTGEPGAEVEILDGNVVVGTAVVANDGTWSFNYTPDTGDHAFAVRNSGSSEATASSSVNVVEPVTESDEATVSTDICKDAEPGIDQGDTYIVGLCEWLVKIANRLGIEYEALIGVNPQIGEPNLIYPGQVINLPPR